jgi:hypothetical protein
LLFRQQTPIETLSELQAQAPGLPPTGFIFHMSRCGSTLAAQLLAALPRHIVISEAGPIDAVLRSGWDNPRITDEQRIDWLRGLLSALARPRHPEERHFFVKFDSWHTLALPLIQRAFPDVPWIFLYRDPGQVLASHARQPGAQMVPGLLDSRWLGLGGEPLGQITLDEYCARVLARICGATLQYQNKAARFIHYRQLPSAVWLELAQHFQVDYSASEIACMRQAAQFDAKTPGLFFVEDRGRKTRTTTTALDQLAEQWLMPIYTALEARQIMIDRLTKAMFAENLQTTFQIQLTPTETLELTLIELREGRSTARQEQFALLFLGPLAILLEQRMWPIQHATLGEFDLFLVPVGRDPQGMQYEAVFNRFIPAEE